MKDFDVLIIGAGAAGMMCGLEAAKRGRRVVILEHTGKIGEKIRISGGGRCNFTNLYCGPDRFLSRNPHFCKSALARYTPEDFIALIVSHGITWHEKPYEDKPGNESARGQLFCDGSARQIIEMFVSGIQAQGGAFVLNTSVTAIEKTANGFTAQTSQGPITSQSLVIASGGLSIPKIGASNFGYEQAKAFGLSVVPPRPALVPLTFDGEILARFSALSGLSVDAWVRTRSAQFREGLLFTHRGLSGPSILQISSYLEPGQEFIVDFAPGIDVIGFLKRARNDAPKQALRSVLSGFMPARLAGVLEEWSGFAGTCAALSDKMVAQVAGLVQAAAFIPAGSEGYRTAEVTLGGVDTTQISSKTFEAINLPGLYFIGEVLDVTGHLGGHNFQWAWSSGWCAGQVV